MMNASKCQQIEIIFLKIGAKVVSKVYVNLSQKITQKYEKSIAGMYIGFQKISIWKQTDTYTSTAFQTIFFDRPLWFPMYLQQVE